MELFNQTKEGWFRGFLSQPHGIPSDDTFRRVFEKIDPEKFQQRFTYSGVRVTMRMPSRPGEFSKLLSVLGGQNWGIMGIGTYPSAQQEGCYDVVIKIPKVTLTDVQTILERIPEQKIIASKILYKRRV